MSSTSRRHEAVIACGILALLATGGCPGDNGGEGPQDAGSVLTFSPDAFEDVEPEPGSPSAPGNPSSIDMTDMMDAMNSMEPMGTLPPPPSRPDGGADATPVGQPCAVTEDCAPGLTCRQDTQDYISHGQCTTSCTSSDACELAWGALTMCIGAEICVARCLLDSDCPELTRCGNAGWCERTGAGSGNPYCAGSPIPCSLLSASECLSTLGCRDNSDCTGVSTSCYSQFDSFSCTSQDGCYWSSSSSDCSGSARSCSSMTGQFTCTSQEGCSWRSDCGGSPLVTDCESESVGLCSFTTGCSVIYP